ncbi:DUF4265 domain-containing protein [Lysobacter sp. A6]|uniref:DUF4265 domain-containing protein n=1 Tax=Noviluteimonas lactosilytica TaxID=2888523 RepID=A0ABS8JJN8_9GAMM|nr:DUF4265 domain-containing protein [Lysobacter lactosilyticus]
MIAKVCFRIEQDEGFPPIRVEQLDATALPDGHFRLESGPCFAEGVAYHDIVEALPTSVPGQHAFVRVVERSGFVSVSIILLDDDVEGRVMDVLRGKDCVIEQATFASYRVVAVGVPPQTVYAPLIAQLGELADRDLISLIEIALGARDELREGA